MTTTNECEGGVPSNKTTTICGALIGAAATVPNWTAAGILALLGLAGGTASVISSWLSPVLIGLTAAILGRSHYTLYVLKRGNRFSVVTTWLATLFVIGFWTWQWVVK